MATLKFSLVLLQLIVCCFTIIFCNDLPKTPTNDSSESSESEEDMEEERILHGSFARPKSYPYMVSLQEKIPVILVVKLTARFCGGVIIQPRWILTAAHCFGNVDNLTNFENDFRVKAGVIDGFSYGSTAQTIRVKKIILHPRYNSFGELENDIALLMLESPLKYNKYVKPIALPPKDYKAKGDGTILGWGTIDKAEKIQSKVLRYATLPVSKRKHCRKYFDSITKSQLCLGYGTKENACAGDSGGPFVQTIKGKPAVVGVTSFGTVGCNENDPIVYTNVASYLKFIKDTIEANSDKNIVKPYTLNDTNLKTVMEHPYLAAIMELNAEDNSYEKICTGAIIESQIVLTTADCFDNREGEFAENIRVKVGTSEIDNPNKGELHKVEHIRKYRYYRINDSTMKNNIAVMQLKTPLKLSENVAKAFLPSTDYDLKSIQGEIIGWDINNSTLSNDLVISNVQNGNATACKQLYPNATDSEICVKRSNTECNQESGSPLIVKAKNGFFVVGLNSIFTRNCENNQPFLVANVLHYKKFIDDIKSPFKDD
ncbi:serine protease 40-like isoform X3 [Chrysoperla carnea]|uniref:serine protease 40-like isoform X3 n=1 Tax=Chrysoperla carnea TaxID=189513 RepID=UPI001D060D35|nr:serine protease 40-like isoform X3 [Chrysoperla carnea]